MAKQGDKPVNTPVDEGRVQLDKMYGIVFVVDGSRQEMAIMQTEGPWRRREDESWRQLPEAERARTGDRFKAEVNRRMSRLWAYAPVWMAFERGGDMQSMDVAREEFARAGWYVGQEVEFKGRDGDPWSVVDSVGKWLGKSSLYRESDYGYGP